MIPLYAFLEGDSLGLLIFSYDTDSVAELARKVQISARCRVGELRHGRLSVRFKGREINPGLTVKEAGITPLSMVEVKRIGDFPDAV